MSVCAQMLSTSSSKVSEETTLKTKISVQVKHSLHGAPLRHRCIATLGTSSAPYMISCLAVQDNLLYAASIDGINVYDLSSYAHMGTFSDDSTSGLAKSVAFTNTKIFTAHQDCKIRVWHNTPSKRHRLLSTLPTVKDRLRRFILPNSYVPVRRHKKRLWIEHYDVVSDLVVKEGLMYSVSWDRSLKIWRTSDHKCLESVRVHEDAVNAVAVSDDGTVYTGSADGCIRVWERNDKERKHTLVGTLDKHRSTVNALALNGDGSALFSGSCDRSIMVWEKRNCDGADPMVLVEALWGHDGAILCLMNVQDLLVSGSSDRTVRVWQRGMDRGYRCCIVMEGHEKPVKSLVAVSQDDESNGVVCVCSGSLSGEIKVWEVSTLKLA